jgi:hypothetical protein
LKREEQKEKTNVQPKSRDSTSIGVAIESNRDMPKGFT